VVSVDAPDPLDVESVVATLQSLSVQEIDLARQINDLWERNEGGVSNTGVHPPWIGDDQDFHVRRLEGAGLIVPQTRTGPPGAGVSVALTQASRPSRNGYLRGSDSCKSAFFAALPNGHTTRGHAGHAGGP
jgi:hypothetical protein